MKKDTILGIGILLIILAIVVVSAATKPLPAKAPGATETTSALPIGGYIEHANYYDIAANYASSTPLLVKVGATADMSAVARMQKFVSDTIVQFKTDGNFADLTSEDIKTIGFDTGRKETLQIAYLIASSPHTVSYIFTIYEDTLGAHGNTSFRTFTFDTTTGAELSLSDIFMPGSPYPNTLSSLSRAKLPNIIGEFADAAFIKDGTMPNTTNFQNFFFDNQDFVLLFAPYDVAAYAAGPQTLRIPLTELGSILKPAYR